MLKNLINKSVMYIFVLFSIFSLIANTTFTQDGELKPTSTIDKISLQVYCKLASFPFFWMDNSKCEEKLAVYEDVNNNEVSIFQNNTGNSITKNNINKNPSQNLASYKSISPDIEKLKQDYAALENRFNSLFESIQNGSFVGKTIYTNVPVPGPQGPAGKDGKDGASSVNNGLVSAINNTFMSSTIPNPTSVSYPGAVLQPLAWIQSSAPVNDPLAVRGLASDYIRTKDLTADAIVISGESLGGSTMTSLANLNRGLTFDPASNTLRVGNATTSSYLSNIFSSSTFSTNLIANNSTATNIFITNASTTNQLVQNSTTTNSISTNSTSTNLGVTNFNSVNNNFTNVLTNNSTTTNSVITNASTTNELVQNSTTTNLVNTNLTNTNLLTSNATATNLVNTNLTNTNLTNTNATSSNLFASILRSITSYFTNIFTQNLTASTTIADSASSTNLITTNATATNLLSSNATITNLVNTNATSTNLFASILRSISAYFTNLTSQNITASNTVAVNSTSTNLVATNSSSTNATSSNLDVLFSFSVGGVSLSSSTIANINNMSSSTATTSINKLFATSSVAINSVTTNLISTNSTSTNLDVTNFNVTNTVAQNSTSTNLSSTNFNSVNNNFTNVLSANSTTTNLYSSNSTSTNLGTTNFNSTNNNFTNVLASNSTSTNLGVTNFNSINNTFTNTTSTNLFANNLSANNTYLGTLNVSGAATSSSLVITGNGEGITFTGSSNHILQALGGTLRLATTTLMGDISFSGYNANGIGNLNTTGDTTIGDGIGDILTVNATATFNRALNMNSNKIVNLALPTNPNDAVNKSYVDSAFASGVLWQKPVISFATTSAPGSPANGDRYILATGATGFGSCAIKDIVEWNGSSWVCTTPTTGSTAFVDNGLDTPYNYNGTAWVSISGSVNHNTLVGLQGGQASEYYHLNLADYNALNISNTNQIKNAVGTAALPSYTFLSNTDTGMYRYGSQAIGFSTAGVGRIYITNTGDLLPVSNLTTSLGTNSNRYTNLFVQNIYATSSVITESTSTRAYFAKMLADTASSTALDVAGYFAIGGVQLSSSTVANLNNMSNTGGTTNITNLSSTNTTAVNSTTTNLFSINSTSTNLGATNFNSTNNNFTNVLASNSTSTNLGATNFNSINSNITNSVAQNSTSTNLFTNSFSAADSYITNLNLSGYFKDTTGSGGTSGNILTSTGTSTKWVANTAWSTNGNSGTNPATNFLGTTDNQPLLFKTNNTEYLRITTAGRFAVSNTLFDGYGANLFFGQAGNDTMTGGTNSAFGMGSMYSNTSGARNSALGAHTLELNTTGSYNTAVGVQTLNQNTTGSYNTAVGLGAMANNSTGSYNTAVGREALSSATAGTNNTAIGFNSSHQDTGSNNTSLGNYALFSKGAGDNNLAMGYNAAENQTSGDNNIAIGANARLANTSGSNQLNFANIIFGTGLTGSVSAPAGNVGVGTSAPGNRLEISSDNTTDLNFATGLRFTNATSGSQVATSTSRFLTLNENGDVVFASSTGGGVIGVGSAMNTVNYYVSTPSNSVSLSGYYKLVVSGIVPVYQNGSATFNNVDKNIYFTDSYNLKKVDLTTNTISNLSAAPQDSILNITSDSNGNIYTIDNIGGAIYKTTIGGTYSLFASLSGYAGGFYGITTDKDNNLYVSSSADNKVVKITPAGVVSTFASGLTCSSPGYILVDSSSNLYTSGSGCINKITSAGLVSTFASDGGIQYHSISKVDSYGNLYAVIPGGTAYLNKYNSSGSLIYSIPTGGINATSLHIDPNGDIYVGNYGTNDITRVTPDGLATKFLVLTFQSPKFLLGSPDGGMYVTNGNSIVKLILNGSLKTSSNATTSILTLEANKPLFIKPQLTYGQYNSSTSTLDALVVSGVIRARGLTVDYAADLAETFPVDSNDINTIGSTSVNSNNTNGNVGSMTGGTIEPGTLVSFSQSTVDWNTKTGTEVNNYTNPSDTYKISTVKTATYGEDVIGVVSSNPGLLLGGKGGVPVAFQGRVPVRVDSANGIIRKGDSITLSTTTPGVGTKLTSNEGEIVGIAMSDDNGSGKVLILVQNGYKKLNFSLSSSTANLLAGNTGITNMNNTMLTNVTAIRSSSGNWSIDENGKIKAKEICLDDDQGSVCFKAEDLRQKGIGTVTEKQATSTANSTAGAAISASTSSSTSTTTDTAVNNNSDNSSTSSAASDTSASTSPATSGESSANSSVNTSSVSTETSSTNSNTSSDTTSTSVQ